MRKQLLLIVLIMPIFMFGQPWKENLPKREGNQKYTFYEMQKAFYDYCDTHNVKDGKMDVNGKLVKMPGYKQFKRWEWDMRTQIDPLTGEFPKKTAQQVYDQYKLNTKNVDDLANWTSVGPNSTAGGYAGIGRINCVAFHPTDNDTYWIGAPSGGLWVTTNDGDSWTCLTDNNNVLGISDIIIPSDYATSKTIYIATGDRDAVDNNSIGVLKTTDGGATWNSTGISYAISDGKMVNRLLLDPNDDNTIIAATSDGVYKTTNGGTTWNDQLTSYNFTDMEYKPGDFNTLYGSSYGQVYYSTNGGESWTNSLSLTSARRTEIAVTPADSAIVYAVVAGTDNGLKSIQKSTNSGVSFTQVLSGSTTNLLGWDSDGNDDGGQGWYDLCIAVSPTDENIVLVGGVNTWGSTNGGSSWSIKNHWYGDGVQAVHADKHNLVYRSNGDLFEVNDGGVYRSANNGLSWSDKSSGVTISQMYRLSVAQTDNDMTINGLQDNGSKMVNGGYWQDVTGGDGMECLIDYTTKSTQYATYANGRIYRTLNTWGNYITISDNIPGGANGAWVTPYIIDPNDNETIYVGYQDVWKSTNQGSSFTKISTMNTSNKIRSMAIAPSNSDVMYVANDYTLWKTTNGGDSWSTVSGLPGGNSITYIAIKNDDPNTVWVSLGGYNSHNVYETANAGVSWTNISAGLPALPAYTIVQNKLITDEVHLYVGTELGVYFKEGFNNWVEFNSGLPNVKIGEIEIYYDVIPENCKLRAATYGRGLWESNLYFPAAEPPVAAFSASETTIFENQAITFTDESSNSPATWTWTFEGGTPATSTEQNPEVTYSTPGIYDVTLVASNDVGQDELVKTDYITVNETIAPVAGFTTLDNTAFVGQQVQFIDTSANVPTSWAWTFTGASVANSNEQNPTVTYSAVGTYDVELTVTNSAGSDTESKTAYITVEEIPAYPPVTNLQASAVEADVNLSWDLPLLDTIIAQGFEGTWPPEGWTIMHSGTDSPFVPVDVPTESTWVQNDENTFSGGPHPEYIHSGIYSAGIGYTAPDFNWLITPEFVAEDNTKLDFWLWYYNSSSYKTYFHVYVKDNDTWTSILDYSDDTPNNEMESPVELDLSTYATKTIQLAFVYEYNDGYQLFVDDVYIGAKADNFELYRNDALLSTLTDVSTDTYADTNLEVGVYDYYMIANYVNPDGSSNASNTASVEVVVSPTADFEATPRSGSYPLEVTFNNLSENATQYTWDFGDDNSSTDENPAHTYAARGTYTVALTASSDYGSATETKTDYIYVTDQQIVVNFSASPTIGTFPHEVTFTNSTTGATNYSWDFGDGNTSTDENPIHTYSEAGIYSVKLTASNEDFEESLTKSSYIFVKWPDPIAQFSAAPLTGIDPLTVTFTDESEYVQNWNWDFGDGETSTEQNPEHVYTKGTYQVKLSVSNADGNDTEVKENYITVDPNGIPENWADKLQVFPNPARDFITIQLDNQNQQKTQIELYDLQGKVIFKSVQTQQANVSEKINVSDFEAGSYIIKLQIGNEILMIRVAVE